MAVGYSHVATVAALLEAGADPEVQDRQSRDVIALVESIREKMPIAPEYMGRRMALEQVTALLAGKSHPADVLLQQCCRDLHFAVLSGSYLHSWTSVRVQTSDGIACSCCKGAWTAFVCVFRTMQACQRHVLKAFWIFRA